MTTLHIRLLNLVFLIIFDEFINICVCSSVIPLRVEYFLVDVLVACCHLASGWPVVDRKLIIFANELLEYKFRQPFEIPI